MPTIAHSASCDFARPSSAFTHAVMRQKTIRRSARSSGSSVRLARPAPPQSGRNSRTRSNSFSFDAFGRQTIYIRTAPDTAAPDPASAFRSSRSRPDTAMRSHLHNYSPSSESEQMDDRPNRRGAEQNAVEAIHDAAVAGKDGSVILHAASGASPATRSGRQPGTSRPPPRPSAANAMGGKLDLLRARRAEAAGPARRACSPEAGPPATAMSAAKTTLAISPPIEALRWSFSG